LTYYHHTHTTKNPPKPTETAITANMVTRFTTKGDRAPVQDQGRANSERAIERGTNKKWLDGMEADADMEVAEAMRKVK
jgi:hypothetical protein